ncbi:MULTISPECIES: hypothetical protein [Virgibacillus]|uniref:DUF5082 domain-containing protein n=2 Tax=Virgibacillus TaxID=84406 RepID=A0A024Q8G1_9BACI|nr:MULTISPECIES: hypothetical protein [Virgibacillus]EQB37935.1 hypothetical protein M948_05040 [Virgibacillus sp. CM-4]GGJ73215.1 hypothetical protein GCM10007111_38490 [Virgibacillus kapii]CDQ38552.1 hypothetical protein BN990_00823 [Virgibacillus massiliensis]
MELNLHKLNSELLELQRLIGIANLRLEEKNEELRRLNSALSQLQLNKSDFNRTKSICIEPEFTTKTLHGNNATKIHNFRENELQVSFSAISDKDISDAENRIIVQINQIKQEIYVIESNISSMETQHTNVNRQKREVENQS